MEVIAGDSGENNLRGSQGGDAISGFESNDTLMGAPGDDFLFGGAGDDLLLGRPGHDVLSGGAGDDDMRGGLGNDYLNGDSGDDSIKGGSGNDTLVGYDIFGDTPYVRENFLLFTDEEAVAWPEYQEPDAPEANTLVGEEGNDALFLGAGDVASGGADQDAFFIYEWANAEGNAPEITDFNDEEDVLILRHYGEPPTLTLQTVGDEHHLFANDELVARLTRNSGPVTLENIELFSVPTPEV